MPQRHPTGFVTGCSAADLTTQPGASFSAYSSHQWKLFEAALVELELRADAAVVALQAAVTNSGGQLISYQGLVPLNEAASDLGFIDDRLKATVAHLRNPSMAAWLTLAISSQTKVAPLFATAKQSGQTLLLQNPTFDFAQLP